MCAGHVERDNMNLETLLAMRPILPIFVLVTLATGCRTMPITGTTATGQPLSTGMGSATYYNDNLERRTAHAFDGYYQGAQKVDEEDFFRIAGDTQAADEVHAARARARFFQPVGVGLLVAGASALGVGAVLAVLNPPPADDSMQSPQSAAMLQTGLITAAIGALVGIGGWVLLGASNTALEPDHWFMLDKNDLPTRGDQAAEIYNRTLMKSALPTDAPLRALVLVR